MARDETQLPPRRNNDAAGFTLGDPAFWGHNNPLGSSNLRSSEVRVRNKEADQIAKELARLLAKTFLPGLNSAPIGSEFEKLLTRTDINRPYTPRQLDEEVVRPGSVDAKAQAKKFRIRDAGRALGRSARKIIPGIFGDVRGIVASGSPSEARAIDVAYQWGEWIDKSAHGQLDPGRGRPGRTGAAATRRFEPSAAGSTNRSGAGSTRPGTPGIADQDARDPDVQPSVVSIDIGFDPVRLDLPTGTVVPKSVRRAASSSTRTVPRAVTSPTPAVSVGSPLFAANPFPGLPGTKPYTMPKSLKRRQESREAAAARARGKPQPGPTALGVPPNYTSNSPCECTKTKKSSAKRCTNPQISKTIADGIITIKRKLVCR